LLLRMLPCACFARHAHMRTPWSGSPMKAGSADQALDLSCAGSGRFFPWWVAGMNDIDSPLLRTTNNRDECAMTTPGRAEGDRWL
jgi:hypothetical protein